MGQVEPDLGHIGASANEVFHGAVFQRVVRDEDRLPPADLSRPGAIGQAAVFGHRCRAGHDRVLQRSCAAVARLWKRPGARVDAAERRGVDAKPAEHDRDNVATVSSPIGKHLGMVHHVLAHFTRQISGRPDIHHIPEVIAEGGVASPLRQQRVAQVLIARVARLQQDVPLAGVAGLDHGVEKLQNHDDAGGLRVAVRPLSPRNVLGICVAVPRRCTGVEVAVFTQQVGPMFRRVPVSRVARELVGVDHPHPDPTG